MAGFYGNNSHGQRWTCCVQVLELTWAHRREYSEWSLSGALRRRRVKLHSNWLQADMAAGSVHSLDTPLSSPLFTRGLHDSRSFGNTAFFTSQALSVWPRNIKVWKINSLFCKQGSFIFDVPSKPSTVKMKCSEKLQSCLRWTINSFKVFFPPSLILSLRLPDTSTVHFHKAVGLFAY